MPRGSCRSSRSCWRISRKTRSERTSRLAAAARRSGEPRDAAAVPSRPERLAGGPQAGVRAGDAESRVTALPFEVHRLGLVPYAEAVEIQRERVERRRAGEITDQLLLLEHPHVITLGSSARAEHVLLDEQERRLLGIEMFETGRGGDVTYHGPGQLVGYPILALEPARRDLHRYIRDIEEALIRALADFEIEAGRREGLTGVWVGDEKIAAIGVRVSSGWITWHGFALNVMTDLRLFESIVPCGIRDHGVTSMGALLGRTISIDAVGDVVATRFAQVFGREVVS